MGRSGRFSISTAWCNQFASPGFCASARYTGNCQGLYRLTTGKVGCENMALIPVVGETDGDESGEDRDKPLLIRGRLSTSESLGM